MEEARRGESGSCVMVGGSLLTASDPFFLRSGRIRETKIQGHGMELLLSCIGARPELYSMIWLRYVGANNIAENSWDLKSPQFFFLPILSVTLIDSLHKNM